MSGFRTSDEHKFGSPQFEDVLLFLVVNGDLADGVLQADGDLVVVRDALPGILVVFVEAHLLVVDNAVHVMPGPGRDFGINMQSGKYWSQLMPTVIFNSFPILDYTSVLSNSPF